MSVCAYMCFSKRIHVELGHTLTIRLAYLYTMCRAVLVTDKVFCQLLKYSLRTELVFSKIIFFSLKYLSTIFYLK